MGSSTQKTKSEPWKGVQDQLHNAAVAADRGYNFARNAGYPGTDPATTQSWAALAGQATDKNSLLNQSLGLAGRTVSGDFLKANPYISQAYQGAAQDATRAYSSAVEPSMRQYQSQMEGNLQNYQNTLAGNLSQWQNAISPGIDAQFAAGGRAGSGLFANARNEGEEAVARQFNEAQSNAARSFGDAQSNMAQYLADSNNALARNLTNTAGQMYYQNYGDERARQNAAMTSAPGLSTLPGGILGQIGSERTGQRLAGNEYLLDLASKYNSALSGMAGIPGTSKTTGGQNPWMQALGLGLQGASLFV